MINKEYVDISVIEQFSYCPKQAENTLNLLQIPKKEMEQGNVFHKATEIIRNAIKKDKNKHSNNHRFIRDLIEKQKELINPIKLTDVYVKSEKLKIAGYCDEVIIYPDKIKIIDYKTKRKFNEEIFSYSYLLQIRCYGLAFKEFYNITCPIILIIQPILCSFAPECQWMSEDEIKQEEGNWNQQGEMLFSYFTAKKTKPQEYELKYNEETKDILEIVMKINNQDFKHENNVNKCNSCQFKEICEDSLKSYK